MANWGQNAMMNRPGAMQNVPPGGGGGQPIVVNVYNAGSVITERELISSIREAFYDLKASNSSLQF